MSPGMDGLLRRRRMGLLLRARLVPEILATYLLVRWMVARSDITRAVDRLRRVGPRRTEVDPVLLARRLGSPVLRTLDPLPWDSRCLMRSLVLVRMLARRGVDSTLVIGVRPGRGGPFEAHAWVEVQGRTVLPTLGYSPLTVL